MTNPFRLSSQRKRIGARFFPLVIAVPVPIHASPSDPLAPGRLAPEMCHFASRAGAPVDYIQGGRAEVLSDCSRLAVAARLVAREPAKARETLSSVTGALRYSAEYRHWSGRIALSEGRAAEAFALLDPRLHGWSPDLYTTWDLAVAAAIVGEDDTALEAYARVGEYGVAGGRERLALLLETAAVASRRGLDGAVRAGVMLESMDWSDTDPDTCPVLAAMRLYIERLTARPSKGGPLPCNDESRWVQALASGTRVAAVFAEAPAFGSWLRLARNERLALAALGLGRGLRSLRVRLWSSIEPRGNVALARIRGRALSDLGVR